jgi:hypothetical protein
LNQPDDALAPRQPVDATPRVIRNHQRFALSEVTFEGGAVGGATIDSWQNATGADCWVARVLMPSTDVRTAGALAGRTRDGRVLRGRVSLAGPEPDARPRGAILIEWHGVSALLADAPTPDGTTEA